MLEVHKMAFRKNDHPCRRNIMFRSVLQEHLTADVQAFIDFLSMQ